MQDLNVTIIQTALHWEDIDANLSMFGQKISAVTSPTGLIVLPEMFSTGFTMNAAALAEPVGGKTTEWMAEQAKKKNAVITGSVIIRENGKYYNRMIWMRPDGSFEHYDKKHLFTLAKEEKTYSAGNKRLIVELKGWKICPQVCYDLRFPVWNRNRNDYDCIIFVANWPERRSFAWSALLQARAIENQAYVIGVNRVGNDGNDIYYSGNSAVIHPDGSKACEVVHEEAVKTVTLSAEELYRFRRKFKFLQDADQFTIAGEEQ